MRDVHDRDQADEIAIVACAKRELLLRIHRHRLRREDLEDCYSQATLELVSRALEGGAFANRLHIANALELRFLSRVRDRRRALAGRSPSQAALEQAASLTHAGEVEIEIVDACATVESLVLLREDLRGIWCAARRLSKDQRLVLAAQLAGATCDDFCSQFGWSREKYRKVAQRARARIRELVATDAVAVPARRSLSE